MPTKAETEEIRSLHNDLCGIGKDSLGKAITLGARLAPWKKHLRHGTWLDWLDQQLHIPERTAQRCQRYHKHADYLRENGATTLWEADQLIRDRKKAAKKNSAAPATAGAPAKIWPIKIQRTCKAVDKLVAELPVELDSQLQVHLERALNRLKEKSMRAVFAQLLPPDLVAAEFGERTSETHSSGG